MILSRVIAHVKAQNWTAIGLDFVIVVAGVFLGLILNEARQDAAVRKGAEVSLAMLLRDLEADTERLDLVIAAQEARIDAIHRLVAALDAPRPSNAAVAAAFTEILDGNKTLIARDTVYDVMEAQGQLAVLPTDLRAMISQTYGYDFPSLAEVSLQNDEAQNAAMGGCTAQYWNWSKQEMIATSRSDLARLQSCLGALGEFAAYIREVSAGERRERALALRAALRERLGAEAPAAQP